MPMGPSIARLLLSGLVVVSGVASTPSSGTAQERPVVWSVLAPSGAVPRGAVVVVQVTARINGGWHVYSLTQGPGGPVPAHISVAPGQPFTLADTVKGPAATKRFDPNFGLDVETYDSQATFAVPVRVAVDAPRGPTNLTLNARFQTCNATLCLPPHTEHLTVPITIGGGSPPTRSGL
jgi:DsbC/DsbD-like thiol-disulfide interchange protein